jgi:hypothetical protein
VGRVEAGDFGGEALPDAEVAGLPGYNVSHAHQTGGETAGRDGLLAGAGCAGEVNVDRAREIEDAFDGGVNEGQFFEGDHGLKDEHRGREGNRGTQRGS